MKTVLLIMSGSVYALLACAAATVAASGPAASPAVAAAGGSQAAAAVTPRPAASMSELMIRVIYPTSDAVFYIGTRTPASEAEWNELQTRTLMLAESANLLMLPGRARDNDRWMTDAALMFDAGLTAYRAARAKNVEALTAVSDQLYQSCVQCHQHYRPGYGTRRP